MQAIIFADRLGDEIAPLCETLPPALLPIANRPLLEYTLDDLATAGIKEAIIVSTHTRQLEQQYAAGEMWGMKLRYLLSRGEESPSQMVIRNRNLLRTPFLAIRGDILRSPCCSLFIKSAKKQLNKSTSLSLQLEDSEAGVMLVQQFPEQFEVFDRLAWPLNKTMQHSETIKLSSGHVNSLENFEAVHGANVDTLEGDFGLQQATVYELEQGLFVGPNSDTTASCYDGGQVLVGEQCHISSHTQLKGPSIIGHHSYISSGTQIKNSIILPGSYVGAGLQIENAIISGHHMIRIDSGLVLKISDPEVLSFVDHEVDSLLHGIPDRLLATCLLILSIPLWPLALLLSKLKNPAEPVKRVMLLSNRIDSDKPDGDRLQVVSIRLATSIPVLSALPMLWLVVRGDLKLFGSMPLPVYQDSTVDTDKLSPAWDLRYQHCSSGLIGPAQLFLSHHSSEEELRLNESYFTEQSGLTASLSRLLGAISLLFSSRAWFSNNQNY